MSKVALTVSLLSLGNRAPTLYCPKGLFWIVHEVWKLPLASVVAVTVLRNPSAVMNTSTFWLATLLPVACPEITTVSPWAYTPLSIESDTLKGAITGIDKEADWLLL